MRFDVGEFVGRVTRPGERRSPGRQPQVRENAGHRVARRDDGQYSEPTVTLGALEHVHMERSSEEARPVDAR